MNFAALVKECEKEYRPVDRTPLPPPPRPPKPRKAKPRCPSFNRCVKDLKKGTYVIVESGGRLSGEEILEIYDPPRFETNVRKYVRSSIDAIYVRVGRMVRGNKVLLCLDDGRMVFGKFGAARGRGGRYIRIDGKVYLREHVIAAYHRIFYRGWG